MSQTYHEPEHGTSPSTPNWVKVLGVTALVVVLLVGIMLLSGGEHGPGRHIPSTLTRSTHIVYGNWSDPTVILTPSLRKLALTLRLTASVGWIGAVMAFLALVIFAINRQDIQTLRTTWIALGLAGSSVIVPLSLVSLFTGLVISIGTKWGLFRHYWVLISLVLTVIATLVLLGNIQTVNYFADKAVKMEAVDIGTLRNGLEGELLHAGLGLLVLLLIQVLNVYKPRGVTPYGWRKQHEQSLVAQGSKS